MGILVLLRVSIMLRLGSLWLLWKEDFHLSVISYSAQHVTVSMSMDSRQVIIFVVYAKCNHVERRELWRLLQIDAVQDAPWLCLGDFNIIRGEEEHRGGRPRLRVAMDDFNDFIDNCGLVDMKARGLTRSWSNFFPDALCKYMARTTSDHAPLSFVFKNMGNRYGPSPFKFQQMWVSHSNFWEVVNDTWSTSIDTMGLQGLATKLKKVKVVLKDWNRRVFGHTETKIQEFENKIEQLDSQLQEGFSEDTEQALLEAKEELEIWMKREETRLSQQARTPRDLQDLSNLVQHSILEEENANLLQLPSIQEVKEAMFSIPVDSSPGPDGFGSGFYKACWDIVEVDVVATVRELFLGIPIPRFYSASYIVLIPKMQRPTGFDKFRPISLCSVVLSPILNRIISSEQGAFLPGRKMIHMINKKVRGAKGFFSSRRGLRQGDPLSPYLLLKDKFMSGKIVPFSHPRGTPLVSHLLYADDIMLFVNGERSSLQEVRDTFELYKAWSGQVHSTNAQKRRSLLLTSFSEGFFPIKYLGVPLMVGRGIRRKLEGWQNRFLSPGTRLLLLKHVLASIPIHLLSVLHAPKAVMVVLKRLMSNFFWGSWNGKQKRHWVSWSKICSPIREGGLGLRKLEEVQESLFMKLAWNVLTGDSLWANFFKHKYVKNQHVTLVDQRKGTLFWKQIVGMFPKVLVNSWWRVRDGDVSFWRDPWLKSGALVNSCDISNFPLLKVRECRLQNGWDVDLLHRLVGATKMEEILNCLGEQKEGGDLLIWKPTLNGVFSSKSAWDCVRVRAPKSEWATWIWHSALPKKYSVTIWKALHYSLTVDSRISSLGIPLVSRCECCIQGCVKDQDHVLVYGRIAAEVLESNYGVVV
ncbi:hypothetical protein I3760_07G050900 [Carya illinoinensis]|nr:hypothetical protein I3760_07G050900 [Carya illinoinensis]